MGEKHKKAPKGAKHWNKKEIVIANNKYKDLHSSNQIGDKFSKRGEYNYKKALQGEVWPRRGVDAWLQPKAYDESLPQEVKDARVNIKTKEKRIYLDSDGYVVGYEINNGFKPNEDISDTKINYEVTDESFEGGCVEDGAVPIKKRPWCRDPINGY